jgi:hypothetical protein
MDLSPEFSFQTEEKTAGLAGSPKLASSSPVIHFSQGSTIDSTLISKDNMDQNDLNNRFTYHPPFGDQVFRYGEIRSVGKDFAELIDRYCPDGREKSLAMTSLEEAVMWANAAIARNEREN